MDDWLIDDDRLSIERKSILPGAGFFTPDSVEEEQAEREAAEALTGAGAVVIADPDADGLACVALVREAFGEGALVPAGPHEIEEALDRADSIIDDVLTLARDNTTITDSKPVDITAVVEDAWENVRTQTATLEIEDECIVTADPSQVTRLFENLFRNAVEHGDGDVTVRVGRLADAGFYVADDGPGIPPEEREKVFEWAYSLGGHGTGFGLAIVRQIAEAHGWAIAVTESEGVGARFEFRGVDIGNTSA